ncbi:MAG: hypothetical protein OEV78_07285 [Spirochaetia bacterium]|nr:hypothetical protein [Spirochaetia bacterium]
MKSFKLFILFISTITLSYQCNNLGTDPLQSQSVTATTPSCFNCHGENTLAGNKLQWAQAGWSESVHANGIQAPIFASFFTTVNNWYIAGYEWHGSDAFYSNGSGCQICHTKEGFLKKINGDYGTVNWTSSSAFSVAINADSIKNPTKLTCFTCHAPHERGDFTLTVDPTTPVTTQSGMVYNKAKGSLCANCHQVRLSGYSSVNALVIGNVSAGITKSSLTRFGPHHGPQTDINLGTGGAEYGTKYSATGYTNHAHSIDTNANCVNCHMADDFANLSEPARYALSPAVGGHSMAVVGIVHGNPTANIAGCTYTGCHDGGAFGSVAAATFTTGTQYLAKGKAYVNKTGGSTTAAVYYAKINGLLKLLANPDTSCSGLLATAYDNLIPITTETITWTLMPDGSYADTTKINFNSCAPTAFSANIAADASVTNNTTLLASPAGRVAMAIWNFQLVREDKSMGLHNPTYILELLYDTCMDLKNYTGGAQDCTIGVTYTRP